MVVGDKGTPASHVVWQWITSQDWPQWRVEVLTADESQIDWGSAPSEVEWTPPWLRASQVPQAESVTYLKMGADPRAMLASRDHADLVVVGRSADRRISSLGGTSEWLLHHPPSPLAIISTEAKVQRVTVCLDGSEFATAALDTFLSLPLAQSAKVYALGVDDGRSDAAAAVAAGVAAMEGRVGGIEGIVVKDSPTKAILSHLDSSGSDLVVIGTKGLTGWKRIRLGSTAGAVVRSATCNSLVGSSEI